MMNQGQPNELNSEFLICFLSTPASVFNFETDRNSRSSIPKNDGIPPAIDFEPAGAPVRTGARPVRFELFNPMLA